MAGISALRWRAEPGRGSVPGHGYVLYGDRRSGSATVEMALEEIGAPFELRPVPLTTTRSSRPSTAASTRWAACRP